MTSDARSFWRRNASVSGAFLLPVVVVLARYQQRSEPLRWRVALAIAVGAAAVALFQWLRFLPRQRRTPALIGLVVSAGLAAAAGAVAPTTGLFYDVARNVFPAALGWMCAAILVAPVESFVGVRPVRETRPASDIVVLGVLVFAGAVVAAHFSHGWLDYDEALYAIQAGRFRELKLVQPVDSALLPFFIPPLSLPVNGGFITQYPPGWPAILAFLSLLGFRPVAGAILAAITVACVYQIGRRLDSREAGVAGAVLLGAQASFIDQGASYFSHMACMALLSGAALLLLRANRSGGWRPGASAGFLLGLAVATRPLTGLLLGASTWLWSGVVMASGVRRNLTVAMWAAIGSILPLIALLAYNNAVTGDPLTFGYSKLHGSLHGFGFGERGFIGFDSAMNPVRQSSQFTPAVAARHYLATLWFYARTLLPVFLLIPFVAIALTQRIPKRATVLAVFLPLPLILFFWFEDITRLTIELLPFVFVGLGVLLAKLRRDGMLRRGALASLIACQVAVTFLVLRDRYAPQRGAYSQSGFHVMDEVRAYREQHGPILAFVREPSGPATWFMSLNWYNADRFPGEIIVARDLGPENARLARRFPTHRPILVTRSSGEDPPLVALHIPPDQGPRPP